MSAHQILVLICVVISSSKCEPEFDCPLSAEFGSTVNLTCSNIGNNRIVLQGPDNNQAANCGQDDCEVFRDRTNVTFTGLNEAPVAVVTVQEIEKQDEGTWKCQVGSKTDPCILNVYKLPDKCKISNDTPTDQLSLGQNLTLSVDVSDYYCTKPETWNIVTGSVNDTKNQSSIQPSVFMTSNFKVTPLHIGRVQVNFTCVEYPNTCNCSGVDEMKLRAPPQCRIDSNRNTTDVKTGDILTLTAEIDEYPCDTGIKYCLYCGKELRLGDFDKNETDFIITFKVKEEYFNKPFYLKYTCNEVSDFTNTTGVTMLTSIKNDMQQENRNQAGIIWGIIGGIAGVVIVLVIGCKLRRRRVAKVKKEPEVQYADVKDNIGRESSPNVKVNDTYTDVEEMQNTLRKEDAEKTRPQSGAVMVPNVAYESIDDIKRVRNQSEKPLSPSKTVSDPYATVQKSQTQNRSPEYSLTDPVAEDLENYER